MAYVGREPNIGQFRKIDVSSWSFDSSTSTFATGFQVGDVNQVLLSINGVIQQPGTDFLLTAGGTNINFTTAPFVGDECFAMVYGDVGGVSIPEGSITADKLHANLKTFEEYKITASGDSNTYTISYTPSAKGALLVSIDGIVQASNNFNLSGATISFDSNLDSGSILRVVDQGHKSGVFLPVDGSITQSKLADDAVQVQNLDSSLVYTNVPIRVNTNTITTNFTIDSNKNGSVIGPITVNSGVTITINGSFTVL